MAIEPDPDALGGKMIAVACVILLVSVIAVITAGMLGYIDLPERQESPYAEYEELERSGGVICYEIDGEYKVQNVVRGYNHVTYNDYTDTVTVWHRQDASFGHDVEVVDIALNKEQVIGIKTNN